MRHFDLPVPQRADRDPVNRMVSVSCDATFWVPRFLEREGLAAYEPESTSLALALCEHYRGCTFLDIGANTGLFSWLVSAAGCATEVVAFEPEPGLRNAAASIASSNGLDIRTSDLAIGAESGSARFFLSQVSDASNSLNADFRRSADFIDVSTRRLDDTEYATGSEALVMKIDTESTEPDVLRGGLLTITQRRPWIICEVLSGSLGAQIHELLAPLGYRFYRITDEVSFETQADITADHGLSFRNWLLAPEPPSRDLIGAAVLWHDAVHRCRPQLRSGINPGGALLSFTSGVHSLEDVATSSWGSGKLENDRVRVELRIASEQPRYLTPLSGIEQANESDSLRIQSSEVFRAAIDKRTVDGLPRFQVWAIFYDKSGNRIGYEQRALSENRTEIEFSAPPDARFLKFAIRCAGTGSAVIGPAAFLDKA